MDKIRLFDSFAGIGALHKALSNLNVPIKLVGMSEIDSDAIISYGGVHKIDINNIEEKSKEEMVEYLQNINVGYDFKKKKSSISRMKLDKLKLLYKTCVATNNFGDISKLNPSDIPDFDLFNFSFPCQAISVAGKQEGMKRSDGSITSSGLYTYGIEIIKVKKPKYIMIENVKNLISKKFINDFYSIINEIDELGYNCYYPTNDKNKPKCLNAKGFGMPQNRERVFVICIRKDIDDKTFEFPIERDYGIRLKDILEDNVDEKYYLSDEIQERFKLNEKEDIDRRQLKQIYENVSFMNNKIKIPQATKIGYIEMSLPGVCDLTYPNSKTRRGRVQDDGQTCPTLTAATQNIVNISKDYRIRKLTPLECWRLMGFNNEDFYNAQKLGISDSQLYKQAGNSIVVNVLEAIFKNLFIHIIK